MISHNLKICLSAILAVLSLLLVGYISYYNVNDAFEFFACILLSSSFAYSAYKTYFYELMTINEVLKNLIKGFLYVLNSGLSMFVLYGIIFKIFNIGDIKTSYLVICFFILVIGILSYKFLSAETKI